MGQATDAILAYGYDLGGEGWKLEGLGEYGELPPLPWWDEEDDFATAAERHLLTRIAQFTETWEDGREGYFERKRAAKARLGLVVETYCSESCPMYVLAAHVTTVKRGDVEALDPLDLAQRPDAGGWDERLRAALDALGLQPTQERAQWLLCSYWG
ncbi:MULTISPECIES: hypothetical protein [Streptomyces]|uniref:hypothetical protein n=1 Tax=Streptomyces TaxID=1883 RepID=UPI001673F574|nr:MULTISPECIES: hypothetical protein [Streptomyces]MBK3524850.1 hypothetical protein [Streptomyces sp. MBT70]GGR70933.1 hypothetical protein GCM10010236_26490 [Streptomyces eurythermus]